jgi:HK97 family phage prohead protease
MPVQTLERVTTAESAAISGIASSPSVDSYGHSVRPGAFDQSIRKRGLTGPSGVKLLSAHAGFPVGVIKRLRTVGQDLRIEAELNLELQSARDLHSIIKHLGGLNFSVEFRLEDFDVDEKAKAGQPWLIVKRGDLTEVSIVTLPACAEATMDLKQARPQWLTKALADVQHARAVVEHASVVAEIKNRQAALSTKLIELRGTLRKRQSDEETLRQYRHWRDEQARSPRGAYNI